MPPQNQNQPSPFEINSPSKSKKGGSKGVLVAILIVVFLILSVVAGVLLVRQNQQVQEKAANNCPAAEACPYAQQPSLLRNCHPPDSDGTPQESLCNTAKKVETCGAAGTQYCCPAPGAAWTTNMTACAATASPSPTVAPTASPTASPAPTTTASPAPGGCNSSCASNSACGASYVCSGGSCRNPLCTSQIDCICVTATATPMATATPVTGGPVATSRPIPVTGIDWPTAAGIGVGAAAIILSILIAL